MSTLRVGFEIVGNTNFIRLHSGDWSVRVGDWTVTALWGGDPGLCGLFMENEADRTRSRRWQWNEVTAKAAFWRAELVS